MPKTKKAEKETKKVKVVKEKKVKEAPKKVEVKEVVPVKEVVEVAKNEDTKVEEVPSKAEHAEKVAKVKIAPYIGLGRRKRATARVWLWEKKGDMTVNGKPIDDYFNKEELNLFWHRPFYTCGVSHPGAKFCGSIKVKGGGVSGQVGAILLGISRALLVYNPEFREKLRKEGFLTRDPREVERKKVFLRKARKSPQYSKR